MVGDLHLTPDGASLSQYLPQVCKSLASSPLCSVSSSSSINREQSSVLDLPRVPAVLSLGHFALSKYIRCTSSVTSSIKMPLFLYLVVLIVSALPDRMSRSGNQRGCSKALIPRQHTLSLLLIVYIYLLGSCTPPAAAIARDPMSVHRGSSVAASFWGRQSRHSAALGTAIHYYYWWQARCLGCLVGGEGEGRRSQLPWVQLQGSVAAAARAPALPACLSACLPACSSPPSLPVPTKLLPSPVFPSLTAFQECHPRPQVACSALCPS